ncbi:tyrosine-type recombinase/integrase [Segatella copri]|uniref:Site-specific integrase n=1 Tax=Segatella copri TaxID=165179 RepID=A0A6G1VNV1_9BACT|nr:site-specific integrase [Segatella copri]MQN60722.1 site-specific integrase [Segatella copri]MQP15119.1 site-specific integrase [Segatella copri]
MPRNTKKPESLFQFMNLLIALLQKNGQYRTSLHYRATLNSFKRYRDNKDIALSEIDAEVMHSYEAYLHHTAKVCRNTSSFYLRILRATYNKAVAKGLTPQQYPFSDTYTGIAPTRKRAIPTESVSQIKRLESVKDLTPKEEMARDTFLMSFYLRGISFIDLAHLRKSDLKDGYLHYTRSKTRQRLTIRWEKEMQELLEKYQAQTASSPYLFPFLVDDGNKSQDKTIDKKKGTVRLYRNAEARISYHLRKLGAKIGIKGKLTLYVARHSWATAARDNHISISVISEALGHHSVTTTQIYLRSIKSSEVDDANARILAVL